MFLFVMKKKFKYLVFLMPLIFLSSVNFSVKANDKKNTVDKVTVVELKELKGRKSKICLHFDCEVWLKYMNPCFQTSCMYICDNFKSI